MRTFLNAGKIAAQNKTTKFVNTHAYIAVNYTLVVRNYKSFGQFDRLTELLSLTCVPSEGIVIDFFFTLLLLLFFIYFPFFFVVACISNRLQTLLGMTSQLLVVLIALILNSVPRKAFIVSAINIFLWKNKCFL